jgi:hypothetical protein
MLRPRHHAALPVALSLGLAVGVASPTRAQGPGLSSGSGQGTGSGASSAIQRNLSGSASGVGPGSATGARGPEEGGLTPITGNRVGTNTYPYGISLPGALLPGGGPPANMGVPFGPGVNTTFPDDSSLFPFTQMPTSMGGNPSELSTVQKAQLDLARRVTAPGDRSLALQRVANAAIFSNQLMLAHTALDEAAQAAVQVPDRLIHDQRLIAIVTTYNNLGEAHLREGKLDVTLPEFNDDNPPAPKIDHSVLIRRAIAEWQRSAALAGQVANPTYRSELLYRVVDTMAYGSQTVMTDFAGQGNGSGNVNGGSSNGRSSDSFVGPADQILREASAMAVRIERPVWRDRGLVSIAAAAASGQFARALEIARKIPQPEVRTDALVRIAEAEARMADRQGQPELARQATATYREAAQAVASIPLDDPRAVLAGVLIDNLISVGRFEDARASIGLYPDTPRQVVALGVIAESQGRRGAGESARAWIMRDVPAEYRSQLLRRVNSGILTAVEQNRSRDLSNRER